MDVEDLKRAWQSDAGAKTHAMLDAPTVSRWIEARARQVNREVRARLRREMATYIPMLVALSAITLAQGITESRLLLVVALNLAVAVIIVTLWYSERRLMGSALDRSVHDVVEDLIARVDAASHAYQHAYVAFFVCAMGLISVTTWWQAGVGGWFMLALAASVLAFFWARSSGQAYVERLFGPYRFELADCLRQLEEP
jgi:hypothetical protein